MLGRPKHLLFLNVVLKLIFILWHLTQYESCFMYVVSVNICYFFSYLFVNILFYLDYACTALW